MSLKKMLKDEATTLQDVSAYLDALENEERIKEVRRLGRKPQIRLWELAADGGSLDLDYFVPADTPPLTEVIHYGKNTLPVFTNFEKRFCRPKEANGGLYGYNEGFTRHFIGPGYFVAHATDPKDTWHDPSDLVIDYFMVPEDEVVDGWPKVIPNHKRLQMFVYKHTRDFMRRVSEHVTIGKAYKNEKALGAYFLLCRDAS